MEGENNVNFSADISVASLEIQNILMEGESNADPGNNNPGTSSEVQNEGENTYNDGALQTSVSVIESVIVTGPAKTGHVGTNYTPSLYGSYLSTENVYFHSVACIMMPIKCLLQAENCNAIA